VSWCAREEAAIGATLPKLALYDWRDLPEPQRKALMCMALTALDEAKEDTPAATYWGGHERIARSYRAWIRRRVSVSSSRRRTALARAA
jgi:hypothetical protein